ncbi:MAG: TraR/DksA C4-type zinc finger protein [Bacteroidia bacterium]|nr:TraR/DksA C4-type zinc finger protein [Bacteroidia bacterium]
MENYHIRYSDTDLAYFSKIIRTKINEAEESLAQLLDSLESSNDQTTSRINGIDDYADYADREFLYVMIARQEKFIYQLEEALRRIGNKTYGICSRTGKLIDKRRLLLVPHTTMSLEAKESRSRDSLAS